MGLAKVTEEIETADVETNSRPEISLLGWLVSYDLDPAGAYFELHKGKTLISKDRIGVCPEILLPSQEISSPHMAIKANALGEVFVQDIFSEEGSFVKLRNSRTKEQAVNGFVRVKHGDWIRLGKNTKFQVCLIDG